MNIIFIHGAWHTSKCWDFLKPLLSNFATLHTLNMPGRVFENSKIYRKIDLTTYVNFITHYMGKINGPIVLIGHSMAGLVISQVAELFPDRIQHLIYIAAFVASSGESMSNITSQFNTPGISTEVEVSLIENKIKIKASLQTKNIFYNHCSSEIAKLALNSLVPEPLKAFTTPIFLSKDRFGTVQKSYIRCIDDNAILLFNQQAMLVKANIESIYDLDSDHSPFYSQPESLAQQIKFILILD